MATENSPKPRLFILCVPEDVGHARQIRDHLESSLWEIDTAEGIFDLSSSTPYKAEIERYDYDVLIIVKPSRDTHVPEYFRAMVMKNANDGLQMVAFALHETPYAPTTWSIAGIETLDLRDGEYFPGMATFVHDLAERFAINSRDLAMSVNFLKEQLPLPLKASNLTHLIKPLYWLYWAPIKYILHNVIYGATQTNKMCEMTLALCSWGVVALAGLLPHSAYYAAIPQAGITIARIAFVVLGISGLIASRFFFGDNSLRLFFLITLPTLNAVLYLFMSLFLGGTIVPLSVIIWAGVFMGAALIRQHSYVDIRVYSYFVSSFSAAFLAFFISMFAFIVFGPISNYFDVLPKISWLPQSLATSFGLFGAFNPIIMIIILLDPLAKYDRRKPSKRAFVLYLLSSIGVIALLMGNFVDL